jgi:hypothetical protein
LIAFLCSSPKLQDIWLLLLIYRRSPLIISAKFPHHGGNHVAHTYLRRAGARINRFSGNYRHNIVLGEHMAGQFAVTVTGVGIIGAIQAILAAIRCHVYFHD